MLEWINKQDDWVRDALRRHSSTATFELAMADKEAILAGVRHKAGHKPDSKSTAPVFTPIVASDLKHGMDVGKPTILCSLGPLENVGRLAKGQSLSFALDGITLVYGENGSGKSGYCRITKKLCRSLSSEDLIGNVFEEGDKLPAEVMVRYRPADAKDEEEPVEETWIDGTPAPSALRHVSVFDSRNAQLYISQNNRIDYLPSEVALLEAHAANRDEMAALFDAEKKELEARTKVPLPTGYSTGTPASDLVKRLDPKQKTLPTVKEIIDASEWEEGHQAEHDSLTKKLAEDPATRLATADRVAATLRDIDQTIATLGSIVGNAGIEKLSKAVDEVAVATSTKSALAQGTFSGEPLTGVGSDVWRRMYNIAREFARSADFADVPENPGDPCVLCQQPLTEAGSNRIKRFNAFVADAATKALEQAQASLDAALNELQSTTIPKPAIVEKMLAEYAAISTDCATLANEIQSFLKSAAARKLALENAVTAGTFDDMGELAAMPSAKVASAIAELDSEIVVLKDASKTDEERAKNKARLAALSDRHLLSGDRETVLARLADLSDLLHAKSCATIVGNQQLSTQITIIRRQLLAKGLGLRIQKEVSELGLDHLPFTVSDRSRDGHSYFEVGLESSVAAKNERVLSEGEQRALALACFLGEQPEGGMHGIIVDDPVSSLDHLRVRRVAKRLVAEAKKGKQVVIFTHNLLFYNEVSDAAAEDAVPLVKRVVTKSEEKGFGLISESDEPWMVRKVSDRANYLRDRLKEFEGVTAFDTDEYRRKVKDFYTDLRETWERLVEEVLLGKVVERMNSDVKTQSLRIVEVSDEDHATIYRNMKKASEFSGHDKAAGKDAATARHVDMKAALDALDTYRVSVTKRRKETQERREKLESAPAGKTA